MNRHQPRNQGEKSMDEKMFCFQCQETCKNTGCTIRGMCGKQPEVANRMDELVSQLKVLALTKKPNRELGLFAIQSLFMTITNANFDDERFNVQIAKAKELIGNTSVYSPVCVISTEN